MIHKCKLSITVKISMLTAYSSRELLNITIYNTGEGIVDFLLNVGSGISGNVVEQ